MRRGWNDFVLGFDAQRQQRLLQPLGVERLDPRTLIVLFGIVAVLAIGWMLWLTTRAERERDPLLSACARSEERRGGTECVSTCRSRLLTLHQKKTKKKHI